MKRKYRLLFITIILFAFLLTRQTKKEETAHKIHKPFIKPSFFTQYEIPKQHQPLLMTQVNKTPKQEPTKKPQQAPNLDIPISKDLQNYIYKLCGKNKDFYCLMVAVMDQESDFKTDIVSADGHDFGLFQIRDCNFSWLKKELDVSDFTDPYENSKCAVHMMKKLIDKYEHYNLALMAYNMGEYGAKRKWNSGIYSSSYSKAVMPKYEKYKNQVKEK